jgi:hypothetical protein
VCGDAASASADADFTFEEVALDTPGIALRGA